MVFVPENLRSMIENGKDKDKDKHLKRLERFLASEGADKLLRKTYGGDRWDADTNGLYSGTSPLLHAARCGREAAFSVVVNALKVGVCWCVDFDVYERHKYGIVAGDVVPLELATPTSW